MPEVTPTRGDERTKSLGKWLTGSGVMIFALLLVVAMLGLTVFRQAHIIDALASGVSQQRDQFTACKNKPATAAGCTTPVAAEPSVIVKQGKAGPIGATGIQGPQGPPGIQGDPGKQGPVGKPGIPGNSPKCLLLVSACSGPTGPRGDQGPAGPAGKDGEQGPAGADGVAGKDGADGATGAQGEMGVQGPKGVGISSTTCQPDGAWLITYTDGTTDTAQGPCRIVP